MRTNQARTLSDAGEHGAEVGVAGELGSWRGSTDRPLAIGMADRHEPVDSFEIDEDRRFGTARTHLWDNIGRTGEDS